MFNLRHDPRSRRSSVNTYNEGFLAGHRSIINPFSFTRLASRNGPIDPFAVDDLRYHWQRAEIYVLGQLRAGRHPMLVQQYAEERIGHDGRGGLYHRSVIRIIGIMQGAGQFSDLPTIQEYRLLRNMERARFAADLRNRFYGCDDLARYARDEEIERNIARARALDRQAEQALRDQKEREWKEAEAKYKATEEALRAEVEQLKKLKESPPTVNDDVRSKTSRASAAGLSIYPGRGRTMPAGYYDAQMPANDLERSSSRSTQPPQTSNHSTAGSRGRAPFRNGDIFVPLNRRNTRDNANSIRSESKGHAESRTDGWFMRGALPVPRCRRGSDASHSHTPISRSSSQRPHRENNGPPPSLRGFDRVWTQTPSIWTSENRCRSQNNRAGGRSASVSREPDHRGRTPSTNASRPRSGSLGYRSPTPPPGTEKSFQTWTNRDHIPYQDRTVYGIRDPRDRIQTGFAQTLRSQSSTRSW